jgi:predicted SAM-dependent methyltransferase
MTNLNLGSGPDYVEGFINIDRSPNVLLTKLKIFKKLLFKIGLLSENHMKDWDNRIIRKDVRKINYAQNSIKFIYSSHFLEHIYHNEAINVLERCYKFLVPGGLLRLALPDLDQFIKQYIEDNKNNSYQAAINLEMSLLSHPLKKPDLLTKLIFTRDHVHKWHPTVGMVTHILSEIGFSNIKQRNFQEGAFVSLLSVEQRNDFTFYIEASK